MRLAKTAYQNAINLNPAFAPAFLGRALANQALNHQEDVLFDLTQALTLDPHYTDAYLARGEYQLSVDNPDSALQDFQTAVSLSPDSALAYLDLARVQLALGDDQDALRSAQQANSIDKTLVPAYSVLGQAYLANQEASQAIASLKTYLIYVPKDSSGILDLGTAYNQAGQYDAAVTELSPLLGDNSHNWAAYIQRGLAYLDLKKGTSAEADFTKAVSYNPDSFDAHLGLARALDMLNYPGDAYIEMEKNASPLAKSDATKAEVDYWEAVWLDQIGDATSLAGATNSWNALIALPPEAMPASWRDQAFQSLNITPTFTPTQEPTSLATLTPTP